MRGKMDNSYILGTSLKEMQRLDEQARLLFDSKIVPLVKCSKRILEIGCGSGANWELIQNLNKDATYTGIDIDSQTIQHAKAKYKDDPRAQFIEMSGQKLGFPDDSFDLIVIRLVLWAVGVEWLQILTEANRVLKPLGYLYSFEPEDRLLLFLPKNDRRDTHIKLWQNHMLSKGLNPFIGTSVASAMDVVQFSEIKTSIHTKAESGLNPESFKARVSNLRKIFMNENLEIIQQMSTGEIEKLHFAFLNCTSDSFLVETYIVTTGRKRE